MARLIAMTPLQGLVPVTAGGVTLTEVVIDRAVMIAPLRAQTAAVEAILQKSLGLGFPAPGRVIAGDVARIVWAGQGRALLIGADAPGGLAEIAALTDQGDGLACAALQGPGAEAVLARLVPVDLRAGVFPPGQTARTLLGHMAASVTRIGADAFEIMVMRSMAATLVHDLKTAMQGVAARPG